MNPAKQKFNIVSLGCARNLVDSEVMAGLLRKNNYEIVQEPQTPTLFWSILAVLSAPAKEESIDTILEIGRLKEDGKVKKLIVAGCLSQRYPRELADELPEVDFFIGTGEVPRIAEILREHEADSRAGANMSASRAIFTITPHRGCASTPSYTAFLKVSEGLRPQVRLLYYSAAARPASQPLHRFGGQRSQLTRRKGSKRSISSPRI